MRATSIPGGTIVTIGFRSDGLVEGDNARVTHTVSPQQSTVTHLTRGYTAATVTA